MRHPEGIARLIRPRSTWRDHSERGSRDHDALGFEDACIALAGASPLAYAAFQFRHSDDPPTAELVQHLLDVAERAIIGSEVTAEQLVELLLREERAPLVQRTEKHRQLALGLTRGQYRHRIARPYSVVAGELEALVSDAWRVARRRLEAASSPTSTPNSDRALLSVAQCAAGAPSSRSSRRTS